MWPLSKREMFGTGTGTVGVEAVIVAVESISGDGGADAAVCGTRFGLGVPWSACTFGRGVLVATTASLAVECVSFCELDLPVRCFLRGRFVATTGSIVFSIVP